MTKFEDGPAAGVVLGLRRAPLFLRVVQAPSGEWDALDQLNDRPSPGEAVFAYRQTRFDGHAHICMRGGRGGYFALASYAFITEQPPEEVMRKRDLWQRWCEEKSSPATA